MAWPYGMAAAQKVIDAAVRWDDARINWDGCRRRWLDGETVENKRMAFDAMVISAVWLDNTQSQLREAIAAFREASDREHVNGPDLDADRHQEPPIIQNCLDR